MEILDNLLDFQILPMTVPPTKTQMKLNAPVPTSAIPIFDGPSSL